MSNRPILSVNELEMVRSYIAQEGEYVETMFREYNACITELLAKGITSGEVHNSLILYIQSAEILKGKFKMLSELACEQVRVMQVIVEESDATVLY